METATQSESSYRKPNAATRNVDLMALELSASDDISPELWSMVLDEERTQATEILTHQEAAYGVVPRSFIQEEGRLFDRHGLDVIEVVSGGVEIMAEQLERGVPGAYKELRRRQAEQRNAKRALNMPAGSLLMEISANPYDWTQREREAQHYTDLTMIRLTFKGHDHDETGRVTQYNYVLPISGPDFLRAVQTKAGRAHQDHIVNSDELLENPIEEEFDESVETVAKRYESLIGAALLEVATGQSAVRMLKKAIENRREAWEFVNSAEHYELDRELRVAMVAAANMPPEDRSRAMDAIRSGYWKELKDRFRGNQIASREGDIIMAAASRAVADGDVFIACGNTVRATGFAEEGSASITRADMVKGLLENVVGSGACSACGAKGKLYGCGLCGGCNRKWCDIFARTGKQTEIKELAYQKYSRPEPRQEKIETLQEYARRVSYEVRQKREAKKLREEAERLEKEQLARVA